MALTRADIDLRVADIEFKRQQTRWKPLQIVALSIGAGAALTAAAVVLTAAVFRYFSWT